MYKGPALKTPKIGKQKTTAPSKSNKQAKFRQLFESMGPTPDPFVTTVEGLPEDWVPRSEDWVPLQVLVHLETGRVRGSSAEGLSDEAARQRIQALRAVVSLEQLQDHIGIWMQEVLPGPTTTKERALRFLEEAIELVQALGLTQEDIQRTGEMVFERPAGEPSQEVGGVVSTLLALTNHLKVSAHAAALAEIERMDTPEVKARVQARQAEKRKRLGV